MSLTRERRALVALVAAVGIFLTGALAGTAPGGERGADRSVSHWPNSLLLARVEKELARLSQNDADTLGRRLAAESRSAITTLRSALLLLDGEVVVMRRLLSDMGEPDFGPAAAKWMGDIYTMGGRTEAEGDRTLELLAWYVRGYCALEPERRDMIAVSRITEMNVQLLDLSQQLRVTVSGVRAFCKRVWTTGSDGMKSPDDSLMEAVERANVETGPFSAKCVNARTTFSAKRATREGV